MRLRIQNSLIFSNGSMTPCKMNQWLMLHLLSRKLLRLSLSLLQLNLSQFRLSCLSNLCPRLSHRKTRGTILNRFQSSVMKCYPWYSSLGLPRLCVYLFCEPTTSVAAKLKKPWQSTTKSISTSSLSSVTNSSSILPSTQQPSSSRGQRSRMIQPYETYLYYFLN